MVKKERPDDQNDEDQNATQIGMADKLSAFRAELDEWYKPAASAVPHREEVGRFLQRLIDIIIG